MVFHREWPALLLQMCTRTRFFTKNAEQSAGYFITVAIYVSRRGYCTVHSFKLRCHGQIFCQRHFFSRKMDMASEWHPPATDMPNRSRPRQKSKKLFLAPIFDIFLAPAVSTPRLSKDFSLMSQKDTLLQVLFCFYYMIFK